MVYLDISEDDLSGYVVSNGVLEHSPTLQVSMLESDSLRLYPYRFIKKSLDIDITSNLFKFRPAIHGKPFQLLSDFNTALYVGWRRDIYSITSEKTPINKCQYRLRSRGFDVGFFAGPGVAAIGPFSTQNKIEDEYSGFVIQYGAAGFLESSFASFGLSAGFDYLLTDDRNIWIYNNKLWLGFIIGIALN